MKRIAFSLLACLVVAAIAIKVAQRESGPTEPSDPSVRVKGPAAPVIADWPFHVTTGWDSGLARGLSIAILHAGSCGDRLAAGLRLDRYGLVILDGATVSGSGERTDEVTIPTPGNYLVCAYLGGAGSDTRKRPETASWPLKITTFATTTQTYAAADTLPGMADDVLDRILREIRERANELRAAYDESLRLQDALAALDSGMSGPAASRAAQRPARQSAKRSGSRAPRGENLRRVREAIEQRPGATAGEVAAATGIARPTVATTLGKLVRDGGLERTELPAGSVGFRLARKPTATEGTASDIDGGQQLL